MCYIIFFFSSDHFVLLMIRDLGINALSGELPKELGQLTELLIL